MNVHQFSILTGFSFFDLLVNCKKPKKFDPFMEIILAMCLIRILYTIKLYD